MRVILRTDVDGVGKKGDVVDVADGYGRNFLLPEGSGAARRRPVPRAQAGHAPLARRQGRSRPAAPPRRSPSRSSPRRSLITARVGPDGKLFGSVTTAEIADAIAAQTGVEIDRRQLHLDEPIRSVGTHIVPVKLHADVEFPVTVEVVAGLSRDRSRVLPVPNDHVVGAVKLVVQRARSTGHPCFPTGRPQDVGTG